MPVAGMNDGSPIRHRSKLPVAIVQGQWQDPRDDDTEHEVLASGQHHWPPGSQAEGSTGTARSLHSKATTSSRDGGNSNTIQNQLKDSAVLSTDISHSHNSKLTKRQRRRKKILRKHIVGKQKGDIPSVVRKVKDQIPKDGCVFQTEVKDGDEETADGITDIDINMPLLTRSLSNRKLSKKKKVRHLTMIYKFDNILGANYFHFSFCV